MKLVVYDRIFEGSNSWQLGLKAAVSVARSI